MREKLFKIYLREEFNPKFIGLFLPGYFMAKAMYANISNLIPKLSGKLLDIGCGSKPHKSLFSVEDHIGLEVDNEERRKDSSADFFYDTENMPFENNSFDSAFASEVLEHVFNPDTLLEETNRVLKKGGLFLLSTPFLWEEHGKPYDFARYTSFGLKYLLEKKGFVIVEQIKCGNGIEVIFQKLCNYFFRAFKLKYPFILPIFLLIFSINVIGLIISKIFPRNDDMYLNNVILAKKVRDLEQ